MDQTLDFLGKKAASDPSAIAWLRQTVSDAAKYDLERKIEMLPTWMIPIVHNILNKEGYA